MIVCLDIGSTLVEGPSIGPVRRLSDALALPKDMEKLLSRLLFTTDPVTPESLAASIAEHCCADSKLTLRVVNELWQAQIEEAYVLDGAAEAVERLRQAGFQLAFISNIWAPFYEGFRRCLPELAKHYPCYLSFQMGIAKPDQELYRYSLNSLNETPNAAVMIGDTYKNDIAPAHLLGMKTIWLLHRPEKEKNELVHVLNNSLPNADLTLASIADLQPEHIHELFTENGG